jgi:Flp pilus assembly protein TadG
MNTNIKSLVRRVVKDERGQTLPMLAITMVGMLSMVAMVVDIGDVYYSFHQLQNSTDAAALAGAQALPGSAAATAASNYSSVSGGLNAYSNMQNVTITTTLKCLNTLINQGIACVAPANANAIQVQQKVDVPMYFAQIFGVKKVSLTSTATAAMRGAISSPYNVAIIIDTTRSMQTTDSGTCNAARLTCALQGVQTLLNALAPCGASVSSCGTVTNGNVANSVDRVSLFTFPNLTTTTAANEYNCGGSSPTINPYTFPSATATSLATMPYTTGSGKSATTVQMTYQVLDFSSDYRTSDTATSLSTSSNLTLAVGGKSGCPGMGDPGGDGTFYAGALYAAQSALLAEQTANPGSQNVIILLSDGDATSTQSQMATGSASTTVATNSGTYPSWVNECGQAITAAKAIALTGTRIYTVAYGASSSGCATDTSGTYKGYSPCQAMEAIASNPGYFFSDSVASQNSGQCVSSSQPTTNLTQIFTQIAGSLTVARLIPDSTT